MSDAHRSVDFGGQRTSIPGLEAEFWCDEFGGVTYVRIARLGDRGCVTIETDAVCHLRIDKFVYSVTLPLLAARGEFDRLAAGAWRGVVAAARQVAEDAQASAERTAYERSYRDEYARWEASRRN